MTLVIRTLRSVDASSNGLKVSRMPSAPRNVPLGLLNSTSGWHIATRPSRSPRLKASIHCLTNSVPVLIFETPPTATLSGSSPLHHRLISGFLSGTEEAVFHREEGSRRAGRDRRLLVDVNDVGVDHRRRDEERFPDPSLGLTARQQTKDLDLTVAQPGGPG